MTHDVITQAGNRPAVLVPMAREVAVTKRGKPCYVWLPGYLVRFEGRDIYPPVSHNEAYALAREMGATSITVQRA